jgi:hypothetical protein
VTDAEAIAMTATLMEPLRAFEEAGGNYKALSIALLLALADTDKDAGVAAMIEVIRNAKPLPLRS